MAPVEKVASNRDSRSRINHQTHPFFVALTLGVLDIGHATTMAIGGFFQVKCLMWRVGSV